MNTNGITGQVIDASINLHRDLGPGLLESVYEVCLYHELKERGFEVERQVKVPIEYKGLKFDQGFVADIIVNNAVILELKSVQETSPVHKKQLLTYLKLMDNNVGLLLNFGEEVMKQGIHRVVNNYRD
ncbi:MAG: GxxExxY protein [Lentisphaerales bacterium]|nr:GxxExxY protein [Lentisphaerales bacterium]